MYRCIWFFLSKNKQLNNKVSGKIMNGLVNKIVLLVVSLGMSFATHAEFSPAQVQQIVTTAAKIQLSNQTGNSLEAKAVEDIAEKALLEAVADPDKAAEITKMFVAANPDAAAAIAYAVAKVFPNRATVIVAAAIAAAPPSASAIITTAVVTAVPAEMANVTAAAVTTAPQLASAIVTAVVGLVVVAPSHTFTESESTASNSSVKQNSITTALATTLKGCSNDECKIAATVAAVNQGGASPDLVGSLAGEIIRTVIATDPGLQKKVTEIVENKKPASPN